MEDSPLHYKEHNDSTALSDDYSNRWEKWRTEHVQARLGEFSKALQRIAAANPGTDKQFLLQELHLWAESIVEVDY